MNGLVNLNTFLALTGTSGINQVIFDLNQAINTNDSKSYPLAFLDLSSIKFTDDWRKGYRKFTINAYVVDKFIFEEESITKAEAWDSIHDKFKAYIDYLESIKTSHSYGFINLNKVSGTLYDRGMISVDEEIGIGYQLEMEAFC